MKIFEFNEYSDFLFFLTGELSKEFGGGKSRGFLAKSLGYRSPRTLGMALEGKRLASRELIQRLSRRLRWTSNEKNYLTLLVEKERARRQSLDASGIDQELARIRPKEYSRKVLTDADFRQIFTWYYFVIRQLAATTDVIRSPEWVVERLGGTLRADDAKQALLRLVQLGLLERSYDPLGYRFKEMHLITTTDVPSGALRHHHDQMLIRAQRSLRSVPVFRREFTNLTFTFDPERIAEAKECIRQFRDDFDARFSNKRGQEVFQLGIQLFPHTGRSEHESKSVH